MCLQKTKKISFHSKTCLISFELVALHISNKTDNGTNRKTTLLDIVYVPTLPAHPSGIQWNNSQYYSSDSIQQVCFLCLYFEYYFIYIWIITTMISIWTWIKLSLLNMSLYRFYDNVFYRFSNICFEILYYI